MITDVVKGNIFDTEFRHIAFAVNVEGKNDTGVAGTVAQYFTKAFLRTGKCTMGGLISIPCLKITFHGLVCHSLEDDGWKNAPEAITAALDKISAPDNEVVAVVLMGSGKIGKDTGADVIGNIRAIHRSKKTCVIYSLDQEKAAIMAALS